MRLLEAKGVVGIARGLKGFFQWRFFRAKNSGLPPSIYPPPAKVQLSSSGRDDNTINVHCETHRQIINQACACGMLQDSTLQTIQTGGTHRTREYTIYYLSMGVDQQRR